MEPKDHSKKGANPKSLMSIGITTQTLPNINIYPNPTTGELRIENGKLRIENVEVYDVFGKKMFTHQVFQMFPATVINISHLPGGVYFLRINTEAGEVIKKVLKE